MKINDERDGVDIDQIAKDLNKFDRPFILIFDDGNHKAHVLGNMDKFGHGNLYMAYLLEAVAKTLRERDGI